MVINELDSLNELKKQFGTYGPKFMKAYKTITKKNVKKCMFKNSERTLWIVVGDKGDQLVYPDIPYCSCNSFIYSLLGNKERTCYHILAVKMSKKCDIYEEITFDDEEYKLFLKYLINDVIADFHEKE